ncbi:hypothetical protein C8J56DRAFT_950565 [Mycena floridula]|nr:hypothetical protein C8J56DRAFT_950565 [Mycena floridula]
MHCIIRTDSPATTPATKAAHQPAYLRAFKLPVPNAAIALKVAQSLAELSVSQQTRHANSRQHDAVT